MHPGAAELARELRHALDPVAWARDRLRFDPDPWQQRVLRSDQPRILLNCSRQAGKSTVTGILAAHTAIFRPGCLVLLISKAQRQSAELLAKVAGFVRCLDPPVRLASDNALSFELTNGSRVLSLPGDGDTIRGFSAPSLVIEDEASFVADELHQAVRPMLAVSRGRLILLSTPHGKRGHFYTAWTSGGSEWHREAITAQEVPRIDPEWLRQERALIGDWWFRQEYCCEFVETVDQLFSEAAISAAITSAVEPLRL